MKEILQYIKALASKVWTAIVSWFRTLRYFLAKVWDKRHAIGREFKHKQRFVVMDSVTFKEKWSFQLSAINLFVTIGVGIIVLVAITAVIIAFTPLREFIPGYANSKMTEQTYQNALVIDSLEREMAKQEQMMLDIKDLMMGRDPEQRAKAADSLRRSQSEKSNGNREYSRSEADSLLRKEVEEQDRYSVKGKRGQKTASVSSQQTDNASAILLFTPLKGKVISHYDAKIHHYGVDIAGAEKETVKSVAPGSVVFSNFTIETGYVIAIQHQGGMISVYKHNSSLLKHEGDVVRAGEPIAYIGNTGELTTGPHLHFELWVNGKPINPLVYISF